MNIEEREPWLLLRSEPGTAAANMAWDEAMLIHVERFGCPLFRFYGWQEPAASFGYSQHYDQVAALTALRPLVRRPTGGGVVPHDADWTYSLAFPPSHWWYALKGLESYRLLHGWLKQAFDRCGVETEIAGAARKEIPGHCFAGPDALDLLWNGRKIAGAAQRRPRHGLLIQGSIQPAPGRLDRDRWEEAMLRAAQESWNVHWITLPCGGPLAETARELAREKYSQASYNEKR